MSLEGVREEAQELWAKLTELARGDPEEYRRFVDAKKAEVDGELFLRPRPAFVLRADIVAEREVRGLLGPVVVNVCEAERAAAAVTVGPLDPAVGGREHSTVDVCVRGRASPAAADALLRRVEERHGVTVRRSSVALLEGEAYAGDGDGPRPVRQEAPRAAAAAPRGPLVCPLGAASKPEPPHTVRVRRGAVVVVVTLPEVSGAAEVRVDLSERRIVLETTESLLEADLPEAVRVDGATARFVRKSGQLRISAPVAAVA